MSLLEVLEYLDWTIDRVVALLGEFTVLYVFAVFLLAGFLVRDAGWSIFFIVLQIMIP